MLHLEMYDMVVCEGCKNLHVLTWNFPNENDATSGACSVQENRGFKGYVAQRVPQDCPKLEEHKIHWKRKNMMKLVLRRLREL